MRKGIWHSLPQIIDHNGNVRLLFRLLLDQYLIDKDFTKPTDQEILRPCFFRQITPRSKFLSKEILLYNLLLLTAACCISTCMCILAEKLIAFCGFCLRYIFTNTLFQFITFFHSPATDVKLDNFFVERRCYVDLFPAWESNAYIFR